MTSISPPRVGETVLYTLSEADAEAIQRARGTAGTVANMAGAGQQYPAVVVRHFGGPAANLQVLLDGPDSYWATSRPWGESEGQWVPLG